MTNTCEIINFLTERYYEMLPIAQLLVNSTEATSGTDALATTVASTVAEIISTTVASNAADASDPTYTTKITHDTTTVSTIGTSGPIVPTVAGDRNLTGTGANATDTNLNQYVNLNPTVVHMFEFTFNAIAHLSIFFIAVGMTYTCCFTLKLQKTAMHACLCTLGLFLLTEGVQVRYLSNPLFYQLDPDVKHVIHICLMVTGGLLGLLGTAHKFMAKKTHFNTNHGRFGLVALVFWCANVAAGVATLFLGETYMGLLHNIIGLFSYSFFMFSQWIGYESGFFRRNFNNPTSYRWFTIMSLFLTIIAPVQLCVQKII